MQEVMEPDTHRTPLEFASDAFHSLTETIRKPVALLAAVTVLAAGVALETPAMAAARTDAGAQPALETHPHTHHFKPYKFQTGDYIGLGILTGAVASLFGGAVISQARYKRRRRQELSDDS